MLAERARSIESRRVGPVDDLDRHAVYLMGRALLKLAALTTECAVGERPTALQLGEAATDLVTAAAYWGIDLSVAIDTALTERELSL